MMFRHKRDGTYSIFFIPKIASQMMMPSLSSILTQVPYVSFSIKYTSTVRVQYVGPILFSTRDQKPPLFARQLNRPKWYSISPAMWEH